MPFSHLLSLTSCALTEPFPPLLYLESHLQVLMVLQVASLRFNTSGTLLASGGLDGTLSFYYHTNSMWCHHVHSIHLTSL